MAEKDEYIRETYEDLKKLSLDEQKRLEYEVRQKAIRDHNSQMKSAEKRGIEIGEKSGRQAALKEVVAKMVGRNMSPEEIADLLGMKTQEIDELVEEIKRNEKTG